MHRHSITSPLKPAPQKKSSHHNNEAGNRTLLQTDIPNASSGTTDTTATEYTYDNLNRLDTVTDHQSQVTTYTYDDVGNRETVSYPNGTTTTYVYDALNRLQTMQTVDGSNQIISQFDYTVYPTGHRESMTDHSGNFSTYIYDDLYRLKQETINHTVLGSVINSYDYDVVGNRMSATENGQTTTYTYDMNDRMTSSTQNGITTTYTYDDNGNNLSKTVNGDQATFGYDARNKLIEAVQYQASVPVSNVYFAYDIDGNRVQKTDNGAATNFVVDRNQSYAQVVHETDDQNATQVTYTHGDDLISQDRSASVNYYNYDGLGSTRSLTDSAGLITDTVEYNAYGSILHQTGTTTNSHLYTGEQFDASLDNYYLRARYYDPETGRFPQMDTWEGRSHDPATLHKYLYAHADPINVSDPTGNFTLTSIGAALNVQGILATAKVVDIGFNIYSFTQTFSGDGALDLTDLAMIAVSAAAIGGGTFVLVKRISNKIKGAKKNKRMLLAQQKFPRPMGLSPPESGAILKWGTAVKGAKDAIARGVTKADIKAIKQAGFTKKDIKMFRDYYRGHQELLESKGKIIRSTL